MATQEQINQTAISGWGGIGFEPTVRPAPESRGFLNYANENSSKDIKEIIYGYLHLPYDPKIADKLPDTTPNHQGQDITPLVDQINKIITANQPVVATQPEVNNSTPTPQVTQPAPQQQQATEPIYVNQGVTTPQGFFGDSAVPQTSNNSMLILGAAILVLIGVFLH